MYHLQYVNSMITVSFTVSVDNLSLITHYLCEQNTFVIIIAESAATAIPEETIIALISVDKDFAAGFRPPD